MAHEARAALNQIKKVAAEQVGPADLEIIGLAADGNHHRIPGVQSEIGDLHNGNCWDRARCARH